MPYPFCEGERITRDASQTWCQTCRLLSVMYHSTEEPYSPAINIWHTVQTHLTLPLCHVCGFGELPGQIKPKWFGFSVDAAEEEEEVCCFTRAPTDRYTHHHGTAAPYEAISVTDRSVSPLSHFTLAHAATSLQILDVFLFFCTFNGATR